MKNTVPILQKGKTWNDEKTSSVFGDFAEHPSEFRFLPGQKMMIKKVYKESLLHKTGSSVFCLETHKPKRQTFLKKVEILESELKTTLVNFWTSLKSKMGYKGPEIEFDFTVKKDDNDHVAHLKCVLCDTKLVIRKKESSPWNTSNFYTHLRKHVTAKKTDACGKESDRRIDSFFPTESIHEKEVVTLQYNK